MYEKEIESLEMMQTARTVKSPALDTAIALMRAAQPKDEAAERAHCEEVDRLHCEVAITDLLLRERAAARAPLQARIDELEERLRTLVRELDQAYRRGAPLIPDAIFDVLVDILQGAP